MSTKARLAAAFLLLSCGGVLALLAQSPSVTIAYMGVFGGHVQDEGDAIAIDGNGGVYITGYTQSLDFPVTPGAVLTTPNLLGSSFVTKLNANTGGIVYSTFLNGKAGGIGVDTSGSTYVIASIYKTPHVGLADGIEVTKLSPGGNAIVYQTSLPGPSLGNGIAVGTDGSVYITGATAAANFPVTPGAVQTKLHGTDAFLAKLDPAGRLVYATYLGGSGDEEGQAIAVDSAGNAYITGVVHNGTDFPVVNATQPNPGGAFVYRSDDGGVTWAAAGKGISSAVGLMVADHFNGSVVYAALHTGGLFKSRDGGGTWTAIGKGLGPYAISSLALDATNPLTLYAADGVTLYRSVDGGLNFTDIGAGTPLTKNSQGGPALVAVDRANPGVLYAASNWVAKSTDGGSTWQMLNTPGLSNNFVQQLDVDPVSSAVYMSGYGGLQKSTDAGATWSQISGVAGYFALSPSGTLYTSTAISTLRSDDGGATWKVVGSQAPGVASQLAADPTKAGVIYTWSGGVYSSGAGFEAGELYQHKDAASEWQILSGSLSGESAPTSANINHITAFAAAPSTPGRLYYAASPGSDAFVAKIDPTGAKLLYATYLGGLSSDSGNAIAVDTAGNAYVTGATASADFPVPAGSFQPVFVNLLIGEPRNTEGFVAKLDPSGAHVVYSSYLGGSSTVGRGLALDRDGSALVGGSTVCSTTFPTVADGFSINNPFLTAFISRVFPDGSQLSYSTCFGGMGGEMATGVALDSQGNVFMTGIGAANMTETPNAGTVGEVLFTHLQFPALTVPVVTSGGIVDALTFDANRASPGSVVSVFGTGFAFGATQAASFPLTTKLGGVSATIDGIAAPLFYAGPNQINLQVPWEVQPGTSHMVMTNASGSNVPAAFPVQTAAPAIAIYPTTHHAIAFNQDQTLNSSANPAPAQSVVTLYLIGQGPVSNTPATGAPAPSSPLAMATLPASVSLGAAGAMDFPYPATLMYLGLAPTWVGLAQANVQLPDVPPGDYRLQLTVGGAASNVVTISVGAQ